MTGCAGKSNTRSLPESASCRYCWRPRLPGRAALPASLACLPRYQYLELREPSWDADVHALVGRLAELGFRRASPVPVRYPRPMISLHEFTREELAQLLLERPGWQYVESELPGHPERRRAELHRTVERVKKLSGQGIRPTGAESKTVRGYGETRQRSHGGFFTRSYVFRSFEDAIAFMAAAAPGIGQREHHTRRENIWRTVSVWLSTWDIGHKPSVLDAEMAAWLDGVRKQFAPP